MKKKILLDIDEVFCFSGYLELVNEFLNTNYIIDDFTEYYIDEAAISKDRKQEFYQFISTKDQYENPVLLPGTLETIKILSKYYDIYPCSDCRNPFDLKTVKEFCDRHNLWLVEDNCDALGSKYTIDGETRYTGTWGDIGTSSFYPPHHMTMGEGGCVYTNNPELRKKEVIPGTFDAVFKAVLTEEKEVLAEIIELVIGIPKEEVIKNGVIINSE